MSNYGFNLFGTAVDEAYDEISVDGDSTPFPGLARTNMNRKANRFKDRFLSKIEIKTQEESDAFVTVTDTDIASGATPDEGDTTFDITSATGWPASGLCVVDGVPMTFTLSGTTLTVAALQRDFTAGDDVQLGYALPTKFLRPRSIHVGNTEYLMVQRGIKRDVTASTYTIIDNFFIMPLGAIGDQDVNISYIAKGTDSQGSTDTLEIMNMFDDYLVYMLASEGHRIMYDSDRAAEYKQEAKEVFLDAKEHFNREESAKNKRFLPGF